MGSEQKLTLYCCGCQKVVEPKLTTGCGIYHKNSPYKYNYFWKCEDCGNHVGCHSKTVNYKTKPLGDIPTPELRRLRQQIHDTLDPIWKKGKLDRKLVYRLLSYHLGVYEYHTAKINSEEDAKKCLNFLELLNSTLALGEKHPSF
jgi:hypothetical protein